MFFKRIYTPGLAIYSYVLGDEKAKQCVVIDPTRYVAPYIIHAQNAGLDIIAILETHVHADFVSGAKELKHQLNEQPTIYASGWGGNKWIPSYADKIVNSKTPIKIGDLRIEPWHTPGHTLEHITWVCFDESRSAADPWFAFTGDCLFVGGIGRPDLLGEEPILLLSEKMYHTLFTTLAPLPDFVEIFPSHGEGSFCGKTLKTRANSTLGYERLHNPYLQKAPFEEWKKQLMQEQAPFPPYFTSVKKKNIEGPSLINTLKVSKWEERKEESILEDLFLLDVRHPEIFALSHLQNSLNAPFSSSFSHWVGWLLPESGSIGLIVEDHQASTDPINQLRIMGFDQEIVLLPYHQVKEDLKHWETSFSMIEVGEIAKIQAQHQPLFVLDVRTIEEWDKGHIAGSHHIELTALDRSLSELPRDQSIAIVCRSGQRASLAASFLMKKGFRSVTNVRGGVQAWTQAGLPLIR